MALSGASLLSAADNQDLTAGEYVNKATGSFSFQKNLVDLAGLSPSTALQLPLIYGSSAANAFALPPGWRLGLPYIDLSVPGAVNGVLIDDDGRFVIDTGWVDESNYKSGLRYVNDHGVLFHICGGADPLPAPQPGTYSYLLEKADGSRFFFNAAGLLVRREDRYQTAILYTYVDPESAGQSAQLASITDSFGQVVRFTYDPGELICHLPSGDQVSVLFGDSGVTRVADQLSQHTDFSYGESDHGNPVLTGIEYVSGLRTTIAYSDTEGKTSTGDVWLPAVKTLIHADATSTLDHTNFVYGRKLPNHSFTGASAGYVMSGEQDGLMESNDASYFYDVFVASIDTHGNTLAASSITFNYLHLPTAAETLLTDGDNIVPYRRTSMDYVIDPDMHARSTNYARPSAVTTSVYDSDASSYLPVRMDSRTYSAFGNVLVSEIALYDPPGGPAVTQSVTTSTFTTVSWNQLPNVAARHEMLSSSQVHDSILDTDIETNYTLTTDQRSIALASISASEAGSTSVPWKSFAYQYDVSGRLVLHQCAWADAEGHPGMNSSARTIEYELSDSSELTTTHTDGAGRLQSATVRIDLPGSPVIRRTAGGVTQQTCVYDALSRMTQSTDGEGATSSFSYEAAAGAGGANDRTSRAPNGYVVVDTLDALGRLTARSDNFDPSGPRTLVTYSRDMLGRVTSQTDAFGNTSTFTFDSVGRMVATTDGLSNTTTYAYDETVGLATGQLNGATSSQTWSDGLGRKLKSTQFPISDQGTEPVTRSWEYAGLGMTRQVGTSVGTDPDSLVGTWEFDYDPDGAVTAVTYGAEDGTNRTRNFQRDLLGDLVSYDQTVTYSGGSTYTSAGPTNTYDGAGMLVGIEPQVGGSVALSYNSMGLLGETTDASGLTTSYAYNSNGALTKVAAGALSVEYQYDSMGRIISETDGTLTVASTYNLDGSLSTTVYPRGETRSITRDAFGRVTQDVSPSGSVVDISYDAQGLIDEITAGAASLEISYGLAGGLNGVAAAQSFSAGDRQWSRTFDYDGFGRPAGHTTTSNGTQIQTSLTYDVCGRRKSSAVSMPEGTTTTTWSYDSLNQLVSESVSGTQSPSSSVLYSYDGNGNLLSVDTNGVVEEFAYDADNKLIGDGLSYDATGNLLTDSFGATYTYDDFGRLATSLSADGTTVTRSYLPDGLIASETAGENGSTYFFADQRLVAARTDAGGTETTYDMLYSANDVVGVAADSDWMMADVVNGSLGILAGQESSSFSYDAYGQEYTQTPSSAAFLGWKQEMRSIDPELVFLRSRYYHPKLRRFLSRDRYPVQNAYSFGAGDPINSVDPSGHVSTSTIAIDGLGIGIGIAAAIAAPFTGGTSLEVYGAVASGLLGAASSATALAGAAKPDSVFSDVSWVLAGVGAIGDIASVGLNLSAVRSAGSAGHALADSDALAGRAGGEAIFGAPPSRINPAGRDDNCAFATIGSISGRTASDVARSAGLVEGFTDVAGIERTLQVTGLSATPQLRILSRDELELFVQQGSRDDEYVLGMRPLAGHNLDVGHVVHGYWNSEGSFLVHDAQQSVMLPSQGLGQRFPMHVWRIRAADIVSVLNEDPHDPIDALCAQFRGMRIQ